MGEFIRSALGYFGNSSSANKENELVGQVIEVGKQNFRIKRVIAEGGYAVVFEGIDTTKGKSVAIKRLLAHDEETSKNVLNEIGVLKKLNGDPNIIEFFSAACVGKEKSKHVGTEFLIVTEFCPGGSLPDFLPTPHQQQPLASDLVLQVLYQASRAVRHMHKQSPPIIHRDLKLENLLLSNIYTIKLCDFGSASTQTYSPDISWSAAERGKVQEDLERVTTPMYRAPEMLDLYQKYPINEAVDVWALGCLFFYLTCGYHPFGDSAKLAILNANYNLPPCTPETEPFHNLIRQMLLVDPTQRPNISTVVGELADLSSSRNVDAAGSIIFNEEVRRHLRIAGRKASSAVSSNVAKEPNHVPQRPPTRPPPRPQPSHSVPFAPAGQPAVSPSQLRVNKQHQHQPPSASNEPQPSAGASEPLSAGGGSGSVLGFLKGSAGHLMKNLREASSRVMESVASAMPSELDLQYITSRIAVMSYPAESGFEAFGSRNSMEEAHAYLDKRHPNSYAVYNLSSRVYRSEHWFDGRVSYRPFEANRAPSLYSLLELCQNARLWLSQKPTNICVIHCTDGRQLSAILVCCLLCFCNVFDTALQAIDLFVSKRGPISLTAAQIRYIDYVAGVVASPPRLPHNHPLLLFSITLSPVPTFNRLKNGCRPYVDVVQNGKKVYSSMTDYASLRTYVLEDRKIEIILNGISVYGDITISIFHARSLFAGKGKAAAAKICQLQFHTGFVPQDAEKITFMKSELDHLDPTSGFAGFTSRYAESFHVSLHLMCSPKEQPRQGSTLVCPWETLPPESDRSPRLCFGSDAEMRSCIGADRPGYREDSRRSSHLHSAEPFKPDDSGSEPSITAVAATTTEPSAPPASVVATDVPESVRQNGRCSPPPMVDEPSVGCPGASATPNSAPPPTKTETLIEGLDWAETRITSPPTPDLQASATMADIFGFDTNAAAAGNDSPGANRVGDRAEATKSGDPSLLEDFFASSTNSNIKATSEGWGVSAPTQRIPSFDDPWRILSQSGGGESGTNNGFNHNPFDPLGTATRPPETEVIEEDEPTAAFDPFSAAAWKPVGTASAGVGGSTMHTSSSTSNLSFERPSHTAAGPTTCSPHHLYQSVSSSNLTGQGPSTTAAPRKNPFEDFDLFFETAAAKAASAHGPASTGQSPFHKSPAPHTAGPGAFGFQSSQKANAFATADSPWAASTDSRSAAFSTPHGAAAAASSPQRPTSPQQQTPPPHTPQHGVGRTHFTSPPSASTVPGTGARPRVSKDAFADLLGDFGSDSAGLGGDPHQHEHKTIRELRRMKLAENTDPESLKILEWVEGKERNVRALLCTLSCVLWDGVRWSQISMADVMTVNQVKRQYRNAARAVHPDKWMNTPHENMARLILIELNDAMAEFERIEQAAS